MPRLHVYLTTETRDRLRAYIQRAWGPRHPKVSATIEQAVVEFLARVSEREQEKEVAVPFWIRICRVPHSECLHAREVPRRERSRCALPISEHCDWSEFIRERS